MNGRQLQRVANLVLLLPLVAISIAVGSEATGKSQDSTTSSKPSRPAGVKAKGGVPASQLTARGSGNLCPDTKFRINDKEVFSFQDLTRLFANYAKLPKLGARSVIALDLLTLKPCGALATNTTFYLRVGVRDIKQFKRIFSSQVLRLSTTFFKHLPNQQPRYILDLGARTGLSTAYLAATFPKARIVASEPFLPEFSLLRLNTARYSNVDAEYGVVWDSQATIKLGRGSRGAPLSTSQVGPAWHRFVADVHEVATGGRLGDIVPSLTVDDLMKRHGLPEVDLLMVDLDGSEKVVLGDPKGQAGWLRKVKCIGLKLSPDQTVASIGKILQGQGFVRSGRALDEYFWCRQ